MLVFRSVIVKDPTKATTIVKNKLNLEGRYLVT